MKHLFIGSRQSENFRFIWFGAESASAGPGGSGDTKNPQGEAPIPAGETAAVVAGEHDKNRAKAKDGMDGLVFSGSSNSGGEYDVTGLGRIRTTLDSNLLEGHGGDRLDTNELSPKEIPSLYEITKSCGKRSESRRY